MNNDVLAEAILCLAGAMKHISSGTSADLAVSGAELLIANARLHDALDAATLLAKQREESEAVKKVARREADAAAVAAVAKPAMPAITAAMCALAARTVLMRDDQLNVLMFNAMLKLNLEDIKEWLADAARRSAAGSAASASP